MSCQQESRIFRNCNCKKVNLNNGMIIKDSLNHYQITYPDSTWLTIRNSENESAIIVGDTSIGYLRVFSVTEQEREFDFENWNKEQKEIESQFNVIEKGEIDYKNQNVHWNLVKFDEDNTWSLFLTVNHPTEKRFYTLSITVEDGENFKNRICTLESFLDNFEIIE